MWQSHLLHCRASNNKGQNGKKTKIYITLDGKELKQAGEFCYLGNMIANVAKCHVEIKRRINTGKYAFYK